MTDSTFHDPPPHASVGGAIKNRSLSPILMTRVDYSQKMNPPLYVQPQEHTIEGKKILYLYIPESSQVHRSGGNIFDRNDDGDLNITNQTNAVAALFARKQSSYSENKIYPHVTMGDLRTDLFERVRKMIRLDRPRHEWLILDDQQLLKSARLYQKDYQTGKEGFTLSAVMLFGKDEVIQTILPHYRTDALLRRGSTLTDTMIAMTSGRI